MRSLGLLAAIALPVASLSAQETATDLTQCELHIWPSGSINAVDKDNNLTFVGGSLGVESTYETVEPVARSIAKAIGPDSQLDLIRQFDLSSVPQFASHRLVFHDGELSPPDYPKQWLNRGFAEGTRLSNSRSRCYTELHVMFVTYMDQPLKDTLHTGFVMRHFGASDRTLAAAAEGGYHKTSNIVWGGAEQDDEAKAALAASFKANLTKFFKRRKIRKIVALIDDAG